MLFLIEIFSKSQSELIGAGGAFKAATNAAKTLDGILYLHSLDECGNALGVAGAATVVCHLLDDTVLHGNVNTAGANAPSGISEAIHDQFPFLVICG